MSLTDALDRYFAGWNDHDPAAVVGSLVEGGTYEDPTTAGPLSGDALAENVAGLVVGFPDVHFDFVSVAATGETTAAVQWVMHGTNTGPASGGPATEGTIALPGADFIDYDLAADRLSKVVGYFDTATMLRQLGLQAHISPADVPGRVDFGLASRVTKGEAAGPGCFTVTSIDVSGQSVGEVDEFANSIVGEIVAQPGYLGSVFATVNGRKHTFTAWRDVDAVEGMRSTVHRDAMRRFNSGTLGTRVMTSVWVPLRLNPVRVSASEGEKPVREKPLAGQWL
jgi:steroid delta-isomerase-like uncharacterized protein